jgi:hypothetical protein
VRSLLRSKGAAFTAVTQLGSPRSRDSEHSRRTKALPGSARQALATLLAVAIGYASNAFLLRFLTGHAVLVFVVYRIVLGSTVLLLVAANIISQQARFERAPTHAAQRRLLSYRCSEEGAGPVSATAD